MSRDGLAGDGAGGGAQGGGAPGRAVASGFDCLWCGRAYEPRSPDDLEAWSRLCPDCLGRASENPFLRNRLRAGLEARAAATAGQPAGGQAAAEAGRGPAAGPSPSSGRSSGQTSTTPSSTPSTPSTLTRTPTRSSDPLDAEMVRYYAARAGEYDDWYLRRGRYAHGPIADMAWQADLDAAGSWLDALPFRGEIVELAAGTGWWSPLLATKGELWLYDAAPQPLDRARERLLAHGLRAHLHVRDAWAEPERRVAGVFTGFWLSHVASERLAEFLGLVFRWLEPGGLFAFIDSRPDPASGAADHDAPRGGVQLRRLGDGSEFQVRKVFREPAELDAALRAAGFEEVQVGTTSRFFVVGSARRG